MVQSDLNHQDLITKAQVLMNQAHSRIASATTTVTTARQLLSAYKAQKPQPGPSRPSRAQLLH